MGVLQKAAPVATLAVVLSSMSAMGLGLKVAEITAPLRNLCLVTMSLPANFVLMPVAALVVCSKSFGNPGVVIMVVVGALVSLLILLPLSLLLARHGTSACE